GARPYDGVWEWPGALEHAHTMGGGGGRVRWSTRIRWAAGVAGCAVARPYGGVWGWPGAV
ncbi:MAG: hypothetical protein ACOCXZ_03900, partial [Chloroflexota bacterium]